ncbi:MAG: HAMP domain-containing histidine kinase [Oscillospiraceae bacterium]|nr:HAMP domain-containing histidine kinase [Oscillospiraceae bacterium]
MKHSIYLRNFVATALIVLMSFTILGSLATVWSYRRSLSDSRSAMSSTLRETARFVTTRHLYSGLELVDLDLSIWLAFISGVSGFDLLVTDEDGVISACSDRELSYMGMNVPESALSSAFSDPGSVSISSLGQIFPEIRRVAGMPLTVTVDGETFISGFLFISSDMASFRGAWRQFSGVFVLIALNVMALTFVISFVATKKQAEPINEMSMAARHFARGDFSARVKDTGRYDEIGQLAQAFNAMAVSLESAETLRRDFIANLSHELKTPMTVIDGFAEGIIDGTIPPEEAARYLSVISSETKRLSRLVGSMLDISKLQSADAATVLKNSFDISEVVRLALLSMEGKIESKGLDVEAELPEEAVMTRGDKDSITQVVYNLIDNATKFSPQGGTIRLELWKQGERAYVSVENSGDPISEDEMPHIFERFHKADKSRSADREGVGLGLYIVKTILDNHNEDIFVTSDDGKTKFVFTLTVI